MPRPVLSLVLPIYNEEEVIPELHTQLQAFLTALHLDAEVIFVNDGSKDLSLQMLSGIAAAEPRYRVLSFSRNFGHQTAITAGIDYARGHAVVVMDADLQDPPEVVLEMVAKWREGYDVVYGKRLTRAGESAFKLLTAKAFYRLFAALIPIEVPLDTGDFRLMSRRVVIALRALKESHRFVRGMVSWIGFKQTAVLYDRPARVAGETKYPLRKMVRFALDGITSFSIVPLRAALHLGLLFSLFGVFVLIWALVVHFILHDTVPGWTALVVVFTLLSSVQLVVIGILGEYVGRIYEQIKQRPLYIVGDRVNLGDRDDDALDDDAPAAPKPAPKPYAASGTMMGMAPPQFPPLEPLPIPVVAPILASTAAQPPDAARAPARGAVLKTVPMRAAPPVTAEVATVPSPSAPLPTERIPAGHAPTSTQPIAQPAEPPDPVASPQPPPAEPSAPSRVSAPPPPPAIGEPAQADVPPPSLPKPPPSAPASQPSSSRRSVPPPLPPKR
jgi:polyisoprenyl-phosphate glycosyltransferase